jgi:hypothetical protein
MPLDARAFSGLELPCLVPREKLFCLVVRAALVKARTRN